MDSVTPKCLRATITTPNPLTTDNSIKNAQNSLMTKIITKHPEGKSDPKVVTMETAVMGYASDRLPSAGVSRRG